MPAITDTQAMRDFVDAYSDTLLPTAKVYLLRAADRIDTLELALAAPLTEDGATIEDLLALWQRYDVARQLGCSCEVCVLPDSNPDWTLLEAVRAATKETT